jgi:hypothetical protein
MDLTEREVHLIEELGMAKRIMEIHRILLTALTARLGGEAKVTHEEIQHVQASYILTENVQAENEHTDCILRVRLK